MAEATFTFHDLSTWVKQHPYATAGAVFAGGAVLIYMYYSGGSTAAAPAGAASTAGTGTGAYAAYLQDQLAAAGQANQLALQSQALNNQASGLQDQYALGVASLNTAASIGANNNSTDIKLANINAGSLRDSIAGAVSIAGLSTKVDLASIGAASGISIANIQATTYNTAMGNYWNAYENLNLQNTTASVNAVQSDNNAAIAEWIVSHPP